jgi:hypothetical protein
MKEIMIRIIISLLYPTEEESGMLMSSVCTYSNTALTGRRAMGRGVS